MNRYSLVWFQKIKILRYQNRSPMNDLLHKPVTQNKTDYMFVHTQSDILPYYWLNGIMEETSRLQEKTEFEYR